MSFPGSFLLRLFGLFALKLEGIDLVCGMSRHPSPLRSSLFTSLTRIPP